MIDNENNLCLIKGKKIVCNSGTFGAITGVTLNLDGFWIMLMPKDDHSFGLKARYVPTSLNYLYIFGCN